ncbi:MAG TPA: tRNA (N6-threonylcarbamoyladenosine(37)-N6)-methyltransferase TrmO [Candidatus Bathyarchaeia archaeon]
MTFQESITLKPVGYVRTKAVGDEVKDKSVVSEILIRPELSGALDGITEYSHLHVLFWLHEISEEKRMTLKVQPRGRTDLPFTGVFAVRTNLRPNPIGLTLVELIGVEGNILTIRGLDAFNGTPVLDIKPYDFWDVAKDPKVPNWWIKLEQEKKQNNST